MIAVVQPNDGRNDSFIEAGKSHSELLEVQSFLVG